MVRIWDMIFSREIPISLEEQMEIDRRVKLFKTFFYKKLFALEQQPSDKRKEEARKFLDEMGALLKKNAFPKLTENHPKDPQERKKWTIKDQYLERIAETVRSQAERYEFSDDPFLKEFGNNLFFRGPRKGIII